MRLNTGFQIIIRRQCHEYNSACDYFRFCINRIVARISPWEGGGGGGLSDLIREMFTSSRQTGTYQWVLVEQKWAGPLPPPPLVTPLVNHYNLPSITLLLDAFVCRATCLKFWHNTSSVSTVLVGPDRLCSATFEKLLAYGATFSNFSNLEQLLAFWATFEQPCIDMFNKNRKNSHVVEILRRKHLFL